MRKILMLLAIAFSITCNNTTYAGDKPHNSATAQQIDDAARAYLSECINNKANSIKQCIKQTKHMMKKQYKAAAKAEKNKDN